MPTAPANLTTVQYNTTTGVWEEKALSALGLVLTDITDVTITAANLNSLDDGVDSTLHFHDSDRARANHTGTQTASTISNFDTQVRTSRLDQMAAPTATVDFNGQEITNLILNSFTNNIKADEIHLQVRNESGVILNKGDAVYRSGYNAGQSLILVSLADSSNAATMPAVGIVESTSIANNSNGAILVYGKIAGLNTSGFTGGDALYVSNVGTTGNTLTNVKPTGTDLIQKVGLTLRSNATLGEIEVVGALRTNDLPNLPTNNVWIGNGSSVPTAGLITNSSIDAAAAIAGSKINMAITELNDVTAKTGTGTTVVFDTSPTIVTPTIASFVNATHDHLNAAGGGTLTKAAISDFAHQASHQSGGGDALTGNLDATARTSVSKNSGADVGARRTLNFIEGTNVTLTIVDDAAGEEVDITITSTAGGGSPLTTKGDIFGFTTVDARFPVGTNNHVIMADSVEALGVKYALIGNANIDASAAIDFSKLATLTSGNILVGSAGNVATSVSMGGDVAIIAAGTTTIQNNVVTFAKIQQITTDRLLGRDTAATGNVEELTVGGGIVFTGSGGIQSTAYTGDVTKTLGGTALTVVNVPDGALAAQTTITIINAGAGTNPTLTSNSATNNLLKVNDQLEINNVGAGTNPVFLSNDAGQVLDLTGSLDISGALTLGTALAIAQGGSGQTTQQAAIDALTNVSAATNEHVLTKDTATGNAIWKVAPGAGGGITSINSQTGATQTLTQQTDKILINSATNDHAFTLGTDVVTIDKANTYEDFNQTFKDNRILIESPDGLTPVTIVNAQQTLARNLTIPILTGNRDIVVTGEANQITNTEITAGSYTKITGVGTLTAGVWNATDIVFANIQQITTDRILGRDTAATGDIEELTLDDSLEFTGAGGIQRAALTGDVTAPAGDNATTVANVPDGALSVNVVLETIANTFGAFLQDFTASSLRIPVSAAPTIAVNGDIGIDTTITDFTTPLIRYFGTESMVVVAVPTAQIVTPTDTHVIAYNATNDEFELVAQTGGSGEINVTADVGAGAMSIRGSTPKTGVALNLRTFDNGDGINASVGSDIITLAVDGTVARNNALETFNISDAATNTIVPAVNLLHTTSADMVNAFGVSIQFQIDDAVSAVETIGAISVERSAGDDDAGTMRIQTSGAASALVDAIIIDDTQAVTIQNGNLSLNSNNLTNVADITSITNLNGVAIGNYLLTTDNITDLADVTAKTGSGTTVVFDTSPTIVTPTIASFANANHDHQDSAGGGTLLSTSALSDTANIAYLNTTNDWGGLDNTNFGTVQADIIEVINAGAGTNPSLTSNSATNNLLLVNDQLAINNVGAGADPVFFSNDAGQVLDLTGSLDISGTLTAGTYAGQSSIDTVGTITTGVWNGTDIAFANIAQIATSSILGRVTAATGDIEVLTGTQATTLLDVFTSGLKGLAPASGGGTTNFLRADGTWAAPGGASPLTTKGDIFGFSTVDARIPVGTNNFVLMADSVEALGVKYALIDTANITDNAVTFAKMQNIATDRLIGRDTAATGDPEEISVSGGIEFTGAGAIQTSAFTGDVTKTAGGTVTTVANVPDGALSANVVLENIANTYGAFLQDFAAATLRIPVSAAPTIAVNGDIGIDTTITDFTTPLIRYFGTESMVVIAVPDAQIITPTNGHVIAYNATNDEFELVAQSGGGGHTIKEEGTPLTDRAGLNFVGGIITATDDAGNDETDVTVSGTKTEFDATLEDGTFAFLNQANVFTEDQKITKSTIGNLQLERTGNLVNASFISNIEWIAEDFGSSPDVYASITGIMELDDATEEGSLQITVMEGGTPGTKYIHFNDAGLNDIDILRPLDISATAWIELGTTPADAGDIRLANDTGIAWRNAGNTANKTLKLNVIDEFEFDDALMLRQTDAATNIIHDYDATIPADDVTIGQHRFLSDSDTTANRAFASIRATTRDVTHATYAGGLELRVAEVQVITTYLDLNGSTGDINIFKPLDMQTTFITFGTTPAASGDIRLENNTTIAWRNAGNTADETLILSSGDTFVSSANFSATQIQSVQTESDAIIQTFRDDASPTVNDFIGAFRSLGRNLMATIDTYFNIGVQQANITDGAEDTIVLFQAMDGGAANTTILQFTTSSGFVEIQSGYNLAIDTGAKFFLDGGGDTSIRESTPDIMTFEIGSRDMISVNTTATTFKPSAVANEGGEIILEGEGSNADWNIDNLSANLRFLVNTATTQSAQFANLGAGVCDLIIDAQGKLRIDGVGNGDTYLQETNPDDVDFVVGNQKAFRAQETGSKVNFVVGQAGATLQADTSGFLYIPAITSGGAPSGTPAAYTGKTPIVYDDVNDILYAWNGSAWANVASGGSEVFTWTAAHDAAGFQFNLDGSTMSIIGDITTTNNMQFTVPAADTFDFDITGTGTVMSIQTSNFDLPDDYAITWAADSNKRIEYSITRTSLEISVASTHTIDFIINGATQLEIATDGDLQLQQNAIDFNTDGHSITPNATQLVLDASLSTDVVVLSSGGAARASVGSNGFQIINVDLMMNQNSIDFNTDGHSITPSATALAVNTGAITDLINFNTGGTTRFQINGLTDIRVEIPLMLKERAAAVADVATYGQFWVQNTTQMAPMFTDDAGTDFGIGGYKTIDYVIDGGGSAITVGKKGGIIVDFDCEVVEWAILGTDGTTGAIVVDVNRSTYAGFPTTASIAGTELPTITATGNKGEDRTLTSWSDINAGDFVEFEVDSITTLQRVTVALKVRPKGQ